MKFKFITALIALFCLSACGTLNFTPQQYPLRDGLIPALDVKGSVTVNNVQASKDTAILYSYMGTKLSSDYNTVTQVMVEQATEELKKHGVIKSTSPAKNIDIKVYYLVSNYGFYSWKSRLQYTAKLGNGKSVNNTVTHGSGNVGQDLNGCIAEAVINLLDDATVKAYLAE